MGNIWIGKVSNNNIVRFKNAKAVIIVYDLTNKYSSENIHKWVAEIKKH